MAPLHPPAVPSPCVAICVLDPNTGYCKGCYRTIEEIGGWMLMSNVDKRACLSRLAERRREADEGGPDG